MVIGLPIYLIVNNPKLFGLISVEDTLHAIESEWLELDVNSIDIIRDKAKDNKYQKIILDKAYVKHYFNMVKYVKAIKTVEYMLKRKI